MSSPGGTIFYGFYIGTSDGWHNDPDCNEIPDIITEDKIPSNSPLEVIMEGDAIEGYLVYGLAIVGSFSRLPGYSTDLTMSPMLQRPRDLKLWSDALWKGIDDLGIPRKLIEQANPDGPHWMCLLGVG